MSSSRTGNIRWLLFEQFHLAKQHVDVEDTDVLETISVPCSPSSVRKAAPKFASRNLRSSLEELNELRMLVRE